MNDYTANWNVANYPEVSREHLGLIPEFFISATQGSEDATLDAVADAMDEVYQYPYAIVALRDNDTGETKIGRFD